MRAAAVTLALLTLLPVALATHFDWEGDTAIDSCLFTIRRLVGACIASEETALPTTATGNWTFVVTWTPTHQVYQNLSVFFGLSGNITQGGATVHGLVQQGRVNGPSPATITLPADARADEAFFQVTPVQAETQLVFIAPPNVPSQPLHFVLTHAE